MEDLSLSRSAPQVLLQVKREVRRGVRDIINKVGVTSILVTHDRDEAFDIADTVVVFNRSASPLQI